MIFYLVELRRPKDGPTAWFPLHLPPMDEVEAKKIKAQYKDMGFKVRLLVCQLLNHRY